MSSDSQRNQLENSGSERSRAKTRGSLQLSSEVRRWLAAEAAGRQQEAESALRSVFQLLPVPPLPADFPQRVLRRAGLAKAPNVFSRRWVRWSIAASFLLVGAFTALLPIAFANAGAGISLSGVVDLIGELTAAVASGLTGGFALAVQLLEMGGLALRAVQTPSFAVFLAATSLLTLAAFRLLTDLNFDRGEPGYAEPV